MGKGGGQFRAGVFILVLCHEQISLALSFVFYSFLALAMIYSY